MTLTRHTPRISVLGLGKVGACVAAGIASRGYDVLGVDVNPRAVNAVNDGRAPVAEPGLDELVAANHERLRATTDLRAAVLATDVTFIVVATPSDDRGGFSVRYAAQAAEDLGRALAAKEGYHLVVLTSTVLPGSTRYRLLPVLEQAAGKRAGAAFGFCYSPVFITLGNVARDFLRPDFVLIGESDPAAGSRLATLYADLLENQPPVSRMSFENAELTKIADAAFVTMKITFANALAEMCEHLPGGNVDAVTGALGLDARIGSRYFKGGMGYGGPCFPRDNPAMMFVARALSSPDALARATDETNRRQPERLLERLAANIAPGATVAILGLSYKPGSPVLEDSQSVELAERLLSSGFRVVVYDPPAEQSARARLGSAVQYCATVTQAMAGADAMVVTHPGEDLAAAVESELRERTRPIALLDCWRSLLGRLDHLDHVRYLAVGAAGHDDALGRALARLWLEHDLEPAASFASNGVAV